MIDKIQQPQMAPKAPAASLDGDNAFLVACIKCAKERLIVDYELVAQATNMSKGGAA